MSQTRMPSHGHDQVRFLMSFVLRVGDDVLRGWGTSRGHRGAVSLKTGPALLGDLGGVAQRDWISASLLWLVPDLFWHGWRQHG